jgi:hypothetical protein
MKTRALLHAAAVLLLIPAVVAKPPEPEVVQKANQWTLNVAYSAAEQITLQTGNSKQPQRYWYIILSVTNNTFLDEVEFYPLCRLITDTFQEIPADKKVSTAVFNAVKQKHQGSYPFLESLDFKDHRVARGQDNTRDFAIIWPDFDPKAKQASLFIGGLSNETTVVEDPKLKDENGEPKKVFLQKTLQLKYAVAGDERLRSAAVMREIEKNWVMR